MGVQHESLLVEALRLPAALLVETDLQLYRDPTNVAYMVGIEQPSANKRFANLFTYGRDVMLYFRHEAAKVDDLHSRHPGVVEPSEVSPKYWSKVRVGEHHELASQLLRRSYELVLATCSKKGQDLVRAVAADENRILEFHEAAIILTKRDGASLSYVGMPILSAATRPVAKFSWNRLSVCFYDGESAERWKTLSASQS